MRGFKTARRIYFVDEYDRQLYISYGRPAMIQTGIIREYI